MRQSISKALSDLGIPYYYISRDNEKEECIIYNFISNHHYYADNVKKASEYTVLLNLYVKSDLDTKKKNAINAMVRAGFREGPGDIGRKEKNGFYNIPLKFKGYILEES